MTPFEQFQEDWSRDCWKHWKRYHSGMDYQDYTRMIEEKVKADAIRLRSLPDKESEFYFFVEKRRSTGVRRSRHQRARRMGGESESKQDGRNGGPI